MDKKCFRQVSTFEASTTFGGTVQESTLRDVPGTGTSGMMAADIIQMDTFNETLLGNSSVCKNENLKDESVSAEVMSFIGMELVNSSVTGDQDIEQIMQGRRE